MILTGKEKAWVGGAIGFIIGLAGVVVPFITSAAILHYVTIGLAVVGFIGVYFGVYRTTNSPEPVIPDAPALVLPAGVILSSQSDPVSTVPAPAAVEAPVAPTAPPVA
jgi:hypothetical protein